MLNSYKGPKFGKLLNTLVQKSNVVWRKEQGMPEGALPAGCANCYIAGNDILKPDEDAMNTIKLQ